MKSGKITRLPALGMWMNRWAQDRSGGAAIIFALSSLVVIAASGAAVDYSTVTNMRSKLQAAADAAALAGAKEFRVGNAYMSMAVAQRVAESVLDKRVNEFATGAAAVTPSVDASANTVTVKIDMTQRLMAGQLVGIDTADIKVSATGKVIGRAPLCVLGLDVNDSTTILLDKSAKLEAKKCAVYSNSKHPSGMIARDDAVVEAATICSAGGMERTGRGTFLPTPLTDCPVAADPLATRVPPSVGSCLYYNLKLDGMVTDLQPGTYCGGIQLTNNAKISLMPGTYVIKDGPLSVGKGSSLKRNSVGFYLTGKGAEIDFKPDSTINLIAPSVGEMSGILIFEDRNAKTSGTHNLLSDDARMLLGTIYLPRGRLHVGANKPIADLSAFTIVVARKFTLSDGPTMVLNANYSITDVPVPEGLGPNAHRTVLIN